MGYIIKDFFHIPSKKDKAIFTIASSDPSSGVDGELFINSSTNEMKVWYNNAWNGIDITINPYIVGPPPTGSSIGLLLALTHAN